MSTLTRVCMVVLVATLFQGCAPDPNQEWADARKGAGTLLAQGIERLNPEGDVIALFPDTGDYPTHVLDEQRKVFKSAVRSLDASVEIYDAPLDYGRVQRGIYAGFLPGDVPDGEHALVVSFMGAPYPDYQGPPVLALMNDHLTRAQQDTLAGWVVESALVDDYMQAFVVASDEKFSLVIPE